MNQKTCILIGAPVDSGKPRKGCLMGPDAFRTAGLGPTLNALGHLTEDLGNLASAPGSFGPAVQGETRGEHQDNDRGVGGPNREPNGDLSGGLSGDLKSAHAPVETIGWTKTLAQVAEAEAARGFPIFLGGDHALSLGSVAGMAAHAKAQNRPFFVLWLDAHTDFHTPETSTSGNLHGTPLGYVTGRPGFEGFPALAAPVAEENVCLIGLRSVDRAEAQALAQSAMTAVDMRQIDEVGIAAPLAAFLERVRAVNGMLHVSLDVDFLDPGIAPAVGTTVPGGATYREAHLAMEMLHDAGSVVSLDLVELNPFLDERGRTANLMVELVASLFGRRVFERETRSL